MTALLPSHPGGRPEDRGGAQETGRETTRRTARDTARDTALPTRRPANRGGRRRWGGQSDVPAGTPAAGPVTVAAPEDDDTSPSSSPVLRASLVSLLGLAVQAGGDALGWAGNTTWPLVLFYVGVVIVVAPFAVVLLGPRLTDRQRPAAVIAFGLLMYGSWVAADPVYTAAFDETLHVATLADMAANQGWFAANTMLPVSPHYPGLELVAVAVHWLTGLPLIACEIATVALSRTVLVLCLYHLAKRLLHSARAGGLVVLLYATSLQFWFFNAQFSYQTVALAMLVGALWLLLRATDVAPGRPLREIAVPMVGAQLCLAALAITHHLTSWVGIATFWALGLLFLSGGERRRARLTLLTAFLGTLSVGGWSAINYRLLAGYLGPVFETAGQEVDRFLNSDGGGRQVLVGTAGNSTPIWESAVMAFALLVSCLLLVPAAWTALFRRSLSRSRARVMIVLVACTFPGLFLLRFVPGASDVGDRASTFVALALALVVGGWVVSRLDRIGLSVTAPVMVAMLVGGLCLGGGPDWQKVPGPYLPGAEQRSVDGETMAVAQWAGRYLPAGSTFASDTTLSRVLPTVAPVYPVTSTGGSINVTPIFADPTLGSYELGLIKDNHIDFVVVDRRYINRTVLSGSYYEGGVTYGVSMTAAQLDKFEGAPGFKLVLDGPVQVYDVRSLWGGPSTFADRAPPGLPGTWSPVQVLIVGLAALLVGLAAARRRWRMPGSALGTARLTIAIPLLMILGAVGVTAGFSTRSGTLLGLLAVALVGWYGDTRVATRPKISVRSWLPWTLLLGAVTAAVAMLAATAAYHGLFDHAPLPPPDRTAVVAPVQPTQVVP